MNGSRSAAVLVAAALLALATAACAGATGSGGGPAGTGADIGGPLAAVEVREYKGENLGSISDFRENSIKGPQRVDQASYRLKVDGLVDKPASYRYEDVLSEETTYTKIVTLYRVEGWSVKALWEGVLLSDLIDRGDPRPEAVTVVFHTDRALERPAVQGILGAARLLAARPAGERTVRTVGGCLT